MIRILLAVALFVAAGGSLAAREIRGAAPGDFDLYLLSLTWSPGFCASGGASRQPDQCDAGSRLGFLVHGLWPQGERDYPVDCNPGGFVQRRDLAVVEGVMPSEALARHEWRKHGTCSGLSPSRYFGAIAALHRRVALPQAYQAPTQAARTAPIEIERAFSEANPGLRPDMMAVACGRGDRGAVLTEVRLCLSRDLRNFRSCPDVVKRQTCRARSILVPAVN
ncbi:Ribonuclease [Labrys miyagiensis]